MANQRKIKRVFVEYQPNLQVPGEPVRLGLLVEELRGNVRELVLVGREPKGPIPGLELEDAWGPFLTLVTQWVEAVSKSVREVVDGVAPGSYALDELARRWHSNLYVTEPETKGVAGAKTSLESYASRWYALEVGEPTGSRVSGKSPGKTKSQQRPWISRRSTYLADKRSELT